MHRYDAEQTRGTTSPIPVGLAVDGLDELLTVLTTARPPDRPGHRPVLHVHGTDPGTTAEWLVTLRPDGVTVTRRHAKGDLALRGAAGDLKLLLYRRPTLGTVERLGDTSVLDAWYGEFTF